jgi:hypothetical protein
MNRIVLLCCLVALLGNGKADGKRDNEEPVRTTTSPSVSPAEHRPGPSVSSGDRVYKVSMLNDNSWHFWLPLAFTAVVAIGGFYSIRLLWLQTEATTKAANAASLSAEAVLHGERAWLIVNLDALSTESFLKRVRTEGERATRELKLAIKCRANSSSDFVYFRKRIWARRTVGWPSTRPYGCRRTLRDDRN